jgi:hypothetical protein
MGHPSFRVVDWRTRVMRGFFPFGKLRVGMTNRLGNVNRLRIQVPRNWHSFLGERELEFGCGSFQTLSALP